MLAPELLVASVRRSVPLVNFFAVDFDVAFCRNSEAYLVTVNFVDFDNSDHTTLVMDVD
jgi:hypothetical protein